MSRLLLLVDDEVVIQLVLEDALKEAGFEVITAIDGSEAIAALEGDFDRFRAVITDIRMGNTPDGWAIGRRARELSPAIPVVYMSGDSAHLWTANGVPESLMIQKPFAAAQLVTAVSNLLIEYDKTHVAAPPR